MRGHRCNGVLKVLHSSMTLLREFMLSRVIEERSLIYFRGLSIAIQRGNATCIQCCFSETVDILDKS